MAIEEFRNAYYRGWFAARAHRPAPEPDMLEHHFFIAMGFIHGKLSNGGPLELWSEKIEPGMPANRDVDARPDHPVFSTRPRQEPLMAGRDEPRPAHKPMNEVEKARPAESAAEVIPGGDTEVDGEKSDPHLPEKEPQHKLPSRPAYSSGKRRPARFAR